MTGRNGASRLDFSEGDIVMKKLIIASVSSLTLLGLAACSDSTDKSTTQSVPQTEPAPATPPADTATPAKPPATEPAPAQ